MAKTITDRLGGFLTDLGASAKTAVKLLVQSRRIRLENHVPAGDSLYIMGNGPSLRANLDNDLEFLRSHKSMAVNFAANSDEFPLVRPSYYVLADPHFFHGTSDPNVIRLHEALRRVDWPMTLFIPAGERWDSEPGADSPLRVRHFNMVAGEGFAWLENLVYDRALAMPRPRNVMIPSVMIGIWLGFKKIYLLGADHSWLQSIWVDDDNRVVTVQPHFYADNELEKRRVHSEYAGHRLHDVLESFHIAFRSYHRIARYAAARGVEILNATPGSYIDAFPRRRLTDR